MFPVASGEYCKTQAILLGASLSSSLFIFPHGLEPLAMVQKSPQKAARKFNSGCGRYCVTKFRDGNAYEIWFDLVWLVTFVAFSVVLEQEYEEKRRARAAEMERELSQDSVNRRARLRSRQRPPPK